MNKCTNCGSYAINPHQNGRGGDNLELCDVCYWRARVARLEELVQRLLDNNPNETIADNGATVLCAWRHDARRALEEK